VPISVIALSYSIHFVSHVSIAAFCFFTVRVTIHSVENFSSQQFQPSTIGFQRKATETVFAFILDSLGSTELFFILVVALIFFGPRKLPQLAKSMGKGLAEFRKASDDFKRTWEREVALEAARTDTTENSILADESQATYPTETVDQPLYEPADPDHVVARESPYQQSSTASASETATESSHPEPLRKHDWL
jgi:TatA/E family protein of Tat protein translocase